MRELLYQFMNRRISRRSFGKGFAALGLSAITLARATAQSADRRSLH